MKKTSRAIAFVFSCLALVASSGCSQKKTRLFTMPNASVQDSIVVEPVQGIQDSFIRGMDASSVLSEEKSGVKFYNFAGQEQDVLKTFAEAGINCIRLRVWNDPFDKDGNGYGGGNNDLATAIELGKRATAYGMKVCIDFHYSDFWADPKRQHAPKAWSGMDIDTKAQALADFTEKSLTELLKAGVDVSMVQIGNEINYGMAGETKVINVMQLLRAGSSAVRKIAKEKKKDIQIAVHYTQISDEGMIDRAAASLENLEVDYDIFGLSFYPFWDGNFANMQNVVRHLKEDYGKRVMLVETSYCYTAEDGDGFSNSVSGKGDILEGYPATIQGQTSLIRDVFAYANEAGAEGVFYWEGSWIPVGKNKEENKPLWEKYGSGWASSYAADYDPDDAGLYYGGSSWDNQAFFDFEGYPLASINVFKYLKHGSTAPLAVDDVPDISLKCDVGTPLKLPETTLVLYNDRSKNRQVPVVWNKEEVVAIDTSKGGDYEINGTVEGGANVKAHVEVVLLNHVLNPSFEDEDTSVWKITFKGDKNPTDFQKKADDAHSGNTALHFWSEKEMDFTIEQELTGLENGIYQLYAFAQGGDMKKGAYMELFAKTGAGNEQTASFMVTTWTDWKKPMIPTIKITDGKLTFGIRAKVNEKSWGTFDDFTLNRISAH